MTQRYSLWVITDLKPGDHLCWIYETEEEHRALITPYLRQGLEQGEKVFYIVDAHTPDTILDYLRSDGADVDVYLTQGQLNIVTAGEAYMREGVFDPERMIAFLRTETTQALAEGYPALRVTGEMTWSLQGRPGSDRLIEYEAKLNDFFSGSRCLAICQYHRRRFAPAVLLDVLRTHPIAIVGTEVYENFYYMPPTEFLGGDLPAATLSNWLENLAERKRVAEALRAAHQDLESQVAKRTAELSKANAQLKAEVAERKQIERVLSESEERYRQAVDNSPNPIFAIDREGVIRAWNPACQKVFQYGPEIIGQPYHKLLFPEDRSAIEARLAQVFQGQSLSGVEMVYRCQDGTPRFTVSRLYPVRDSEGKVQEVVFANTDITERKRAEEEREAIRELLQATIDGIRDPIMVIGTDYQVQLMNRAVRNNYPVDPGAEPLYCYQVFHGRETACSGAECPCPLEQVCESRRPVRVEHEHVQEDGEKRLVEIIASPLLGKDGTVIGIVESARDITERKRAEEALQTSEMRFRTTFESAAIGIALTDVEGRPVESNPALQAFLGYSEDELRRMIFTEFTHPDDVTADMNLYKEVVAGKRDHYQMEKRYIRKDGQVVWGHLTVSLVRDPDGEPQFAIAMVEDITERKRSEVAAQEHATMTARLASLGEALNRPFTVDEVVSAIGKGALALSSADQAAVYVRNPDDTVVCRWHQDLSSEYVERMAVRMQDLLGRRALTGTGPVCIPNVVQLPTDSSLRRLAEGHQALGMCPLMYEGRTIAVVSCYYETPYTWSEAEREVMETFTRQAAVALENARLYERTQQQAARLEEALAVSEALHRGLELDQILERVVQGATELGFRRAVINVYQPEEDRLRVAAMKGLVPAERETLEGATYRWSDFQPLMQEQFQTSRSYLIRQGAIDWEEDFQGVVVISNGEDRGPAYWRPEDMLLVPLWGSAGEPVGLLSVDEPVDGRLSSLETVQALETFANQGALAIENARLFEEVERLSITDELTGLYNRRHFNRLLKVEFQRARRYDRPLSLLMIDLDRFKRVNDRYGHPVGDGVLAEVARLLRTSVRDTDVAFRYGGEEFVVILPETGLEEAIRLAERIRHTVAVHSTYEDRSIQLTASLGVSSLSNPDVAAPENLIEQVDQALYKAKQQGRNQVCYD